MLTIHPEGIEDYIETLDKAKYVTIRQYIGKEDYYVTSANMMSPEGSDYSYAEDVRVSNRLVKAVRAKALDELQVEVDPGDIETSITNIQEQLNTPVEDAVRDKVISSGSVTIDTEISPVMDYFEIFLDRMLLCRKAAEKLGLKFQLEINGQSIL